MEQQSLVFDQPPIAESVISVQFAPLQVPMLRLGDAWSRFKDRYPNIEEKPELETAIERFGGVFEFLQPLRIEFADMPRLRFWFLSGNGSELIQLQQNRFVRNWRRTDDGMRYPSYATLRQDFLRDWIEFQSFARQELNKETALTQVEITYVNAIGVDQVAGLSDVLSFVSPDFMSRPMASNLESSDVVLRFVLKDGHGASWGRLHVEFGKGVELMNGKQVWRFNLTARGLVRDSTLEHLTSMLDSCHTEAVQAFANLTTPMIQEKWGRKQ